MVYTHTWTICVYARPLGTSQSRPQQSDEPSLDYPTNRSQHQVAKPELIIVFVDMVLCMHTLGRGDVAVLAQEAARPV